jgi:hypothetical protein
MAEPDPRGLLAAALDGLIKELFEAEYLRGRESAPAGKPRQEPR